MKLNRYRAKLILLSTLLFLYSSFSYALPFNIFPQTTLPTQVVAGQTVTALYTVQNNTVSSRVNNIVRYLPPNVRQVTSDPTYPNLCGPLFNLAPKGVPGDSCTLELTVSGAVNSSDPNPHNHLFVCFPGGKTCAGTLFPLNVKVVSAPTIRKRLAYIANIEGNSISICTVSETGTLGPCTAYPDSTFAAPIDIILNNANTFAYVANSDNDTISVCPVNQEGILSACSAVSTAPGDTEFTGLRLNAANTNLYFTSAVDDAVYRCPINANGSLSPCVSDGQVFPGANGRIAFNTAGNLAYIVAFSNSSLYRCPVNPDGTFGVCDLPFTDPAMLNPLAVAIDPASTNLYVSTAPFATSIVAICPLDAAGVIQPCTPSTGNGTFAFSVDHAINLLIQSINGALFGYVPNEGNPGSVVLCPVLANGLFGTCTIQPDASFNVPDSAWIAEFP